MDTIGMLIQKMIDFNCPDQKRINHAIKVYGYAKAIGSLELKNEQELLILEASAILHDIGIHLAEKKYGSSGGKYQEELGPAIAMELMKNLSFTQNEKERICFMIAHHHSYHIDGGMVLQILFEADFIVNAQEHNLVEITTKKGKEKIFKTKTGIHLVDSLFSWDS